ncbi:N-acetyl-gamma-glutamyl-phosphate reductase [Phenylobacterium kunshanense]|uniref:N-acetyl-gamma-glutamyl-phosphate reductase n=1 Tax=Phenylobacterium kunshanense TaxID=1445034 RepID=A0A328BQ72_9CAUL|nr:N-acetyl-gamma-glutamyl-phosphate reductase [Phenylobacterium kunshanense]RAK68749.1 N-acetyl-gamma-glutamyl-phosphate reductase [Phenylobacterium kunshanense]
MAHTVFIDGEAGTTGLQIRERLAGRTDLEVVSIDPARRKDPEARRELLNGVDAVVLCLPDDAAREAVSMVSSNSVKVVDASTAHRVAADWAYGFAEMSGQREAIRASNRVSNPGCYPTGFIGLVRPLVSAGLIPADFPLTVNAVSGYSGGGKGLIGEFEAAAPPSGTDDAFRAYGFTLAHKHLPEMQAYAGLAHAPVFAPSVGRYAQGMLVEVPLQLWAMRGTPNPADLHAALAEAYEGEAFVEVASWDECQALQNERAGAAGYVAALDPQSLNDTNRMRLFVFGNAVRGQARLVAVLDNLGKGASGAAVQNLNLMLGLPEAAGL